MGGLRMTGVFGAAFWLAVLLLRPGDTALAQPVPRAEGGHDGPAVLALGFEDYTGPQLPPLFSLSADAPRTGKACLRWKNDDPKVYQFPTFPVPLKAGRMYDIEAWVRPRGVTPGRNQGGAGLGVEWLNAEGAWGGGDYPEGWVGTTEGWQRLRYRVRIPADMQTPKLVLYARPECTGEAFWDDVTIRAVPMTIEPLSPDLYRGVSTGGTFAVRGRLTRSHDALNDQAVTATLVVLAGNTASAPVAGRLTGDVVEWTVDAGPLAPGEYVARCVVTAGEARAENQVPFHRLAQRPPEWRCWFDEHQRLIVDGKPFFPLGLHWWDFTAEYAEPYLDSPFNCLLPITSSFASDLKWTEKELDLFNAKGIKVIWSVKEFFADARASGAGVHNRAAGVAVEADERPQMEALMRRFATHPAVIAWYVCDEPSRRPDRVKEHLRWIPEIDPSRPSYVVFANAEACRIGGGGYAAMSEYMPEVEAVGVDPYPVPGGRMRDVLRMARNAVAETCATRPLWNCPQIFNWTRYGSTAEAKAQARFPTPDELRCLLWAHIAGGANGLVGFSYFDLFTMDRENAGPAGDRLGYLAREPFAMRWKTVCAAAQEVRDRIPVLLAVEPWEQPVTIGAPTPTTAWRGWGHDGKTWLLLVNTEQDKEQTFEIEFARPIRSATVDLGEPACWPRDKRLTARLPRLGVALLTLAFL